MRYRNFFFVNAAIFKFVFRPDMGNLKLDPFVKIFLLGNSCASNGPPNSHMRCQENRIDNRLVKIQSFIIVNNGVFLYGVLNY